MLQVGSYTTGLQVKRATTRPHTQPANTTIKRSALQPQDTRSNPHGRRHKPLLDPAAPSTRQRLEHLAPQKRPRRETTSPAVTLASGDSARSVHVAHSPNIHLLLSGSWARPQVVTAVCRRRSLDLYRQHHLSLAATFASAHASLPLMAFRLSQTIGTALLAYSWRRVREARV